MDVSNVSKCVPYAARCMAVAVDGKEMRHFPLSEVVVLKVTNLMYFELSVVTLAIFMFTIANVIPHSSVRVLKRQVHAIGDRPIPIYDPRRIRHAILIVLVVWWLDTLGSDEFFNFKSCRASQVLMLFSSEKLLRLSNQPRT